jgi:hypothetical protein
MSKGTAFCILISLWILVLMPLIVAQEPNDVAVEVVATAAEYIPKTTTVTHPGHSYTDCSGSTDYFGRFEPDTDVVSGTATTHVSCSTTFYPATQSTYTTYRRVNYTVVRSDRALILLSCAQDRLWSSCPSLAVGTKLLLHLQTQGSKKSAFGAALARGLMGASLDDGLQKVQLQGPTGTKPITLSYLSAVPLNAANDQSQTIQSANSPIPAEAKVHITSTPSEGEIFIDGKFYGNTPSTILLPKGPHAVKVTLGSEQWSRTVELTPSEISLHADLAAEPSHVQTDLDQKLSRFSSALDTWKSACSAESINFRECRAQVEGAKPALDEMHLQWQAIKDSVREGPPASASCRDAWTQMLDSADRYLSVQDKLYTMYESVDPTSPNAASAWAAANADYQVLQKQDQDGLEGVHRAAQRFTACDDK